MAIQIRCVDTDLVIPVATMTDSKKIQDIYYRISLISDFPELGIAVCLGTQSTLTPETPKPGFKSKGVKDVIYRNLLTFRFNKQMQPTLEKNELVNQTVSTNGSTVYIYSENGREGKDYPNHISLINDYILPTAEKAIFSPKYISARFSSWLYVGLKLVDLVVWDVAVTEKGDSYAQALAGVTQDTLINVVIESHSELLKSKAYVSNSHTLIAERLKARLSPSTTK